MPADDASLSALCQACGLCCDGTLFSHVTLAAGEREALGSRVDFTRRADGTVALAQPCRALERRWCAVYAVRPRGCRDYVCSLWSALDSGEARLGEALDIVARAHALVAEVERAMPTAPRGEEATLSRARRLSRAALGPLPHERALADAQRHLRFHFGWKG